MPVSVTEAFTAFLDESVNLDPEETRQARESRDRLIASILIPPPLHLPALIPGKTLPYGSFARGTKIRPLDELDLMICFHGESATFQEHPNRIEITVPPDSARLRGSCFTGTPLLDSRKVLNALVDHLELLPEAGRAEVKQTGEAVSLYLKSVPWRFDIVPTFCMQLPGGTGQCCYLMPDRYGHWKKTDPAVDNRRVAAITEKHGRYGTQLIRVMKFWQQKFGARSCSPYLMECLLLNYLENAPAPVTPLADVALPYVLHYIARHIREDLPDPQRLKRNINHLNLMERQKIADKAASDSLKAVRARELEREQKTGAALYKWAEVLGDQFPKSG